MAKQTRKAGGSVKVTSIVKTVVSKPVSKPIYPFWKDENSYDEKKYGSIKDFLDDQNSEDIVEEGNINLSYNISAKEVVTVEFTASAATHTCGFIELGDISVNYPKGNPKFLATTTSSFLILPFGEFFQLVSPIFCLLLSTRL